MTDQRDTVVAGVDAHTDEHHVAVLDGQGRLLAAAAFPTTADGYTRLISWLRGQGTMTKEMARPKAPVLRLLDGTVQA